MGLFRREPQHVQLDPSLAEEQTKRAPWRLWTDGFGMLATRAIQIIVVVIVVAAVIWGFAHAGYPQQPFWIRGLEVSLAGIVVGYIVLRWGLLPALVWHYTIDALYTALILLRSSNTYYVLSAALSVGLMLLPLILAIILYARRHYFIDPGSLLNSEDAAPALTPVHAGRATPMSPEAQILEGSDPTPIYHPLSRRRWLWGVAGVTLGAVVFFTEPDPALPDLDIAFTAEDAEQTAIADAANKPYWLQLVGTGITTTWAAHLGAVHKAAKWPAITCMNIWKEQLIQDKIVLRGGYHQVLDKPGLGIELDEKTIKKLTVDYHWIDKVRHVYRYSRASGEVVYMGASKEDLQRVYPAAALPVCERGSVTLPYEDDGSKKFKEIWEAVKDGKTLRRFEGKKRAPAKRR